MRLSKDFELWEFEKSTTASRLGINNKAPKAAIENLSKLAINILQPVRDHFDSPLIITSGYRSLELNRQLRSRDTSQHRVGEAADFEVIGYSNYHVAAWIRDNLNFDQLILECYDPEEGPNSGWVHCSYSKNRNEVMTYYANGEYVTGLKY